MEEEHEVYGGDIPEEVEGDLDTGLDEEPDDLVLKEDPTTDEAASKELEEMKKRLKEMEEEAAALRDMQAKVEKEMSSAQDSGGKDGTASSREEADTRSVFVGNVDYSCTPEEVQQHFQSCGTVNRVTILTDKFGQPKGFAYVEFLEVEAVQNAILLSESELHNRPIKVTAKRTNVPGLKGFRGSYIPGYRPRRPYGKIPRFRRPMRYRPYY